MNVLVGLLVSKNAFNGFFVLYVEDGNEALKVTYELIGKAIELAKVINHPVYALVIGYNLENNVKELLSYGVDKVFVYDNEALKDFDIETYANCFEDFINTNKPSSILVGATNVGRSLAPRVAARFHTGLTADCTKLKMKDNTDLVQIRPAFGGNIMAQIITPNNRPQFATVRYKVFSAPEKVDNPTGVVVNVEIKDEWLKTNTTILNVVEKPKELDISESEIIVAVGRGLKSVDDLKMVNELAELLNANVACSRPMVESGVFDSKHQIGLSGKTVKPKLIITLGISGAVQFADSLDSTDPNKVLPASLGNSLNTQLVTLQNNTPPKNHAVANGDYGLATSSLYGHLKVTVGNGLNLNEGTLSLSAATTSAAGAVQLEDTLSSQSSTKALTAKMGYELDRKKPEVFYGYTEPSKNIGRDGDIYILLER